MMQHFLKLFVRTSTRNIGYTAINIGGLAIGLASSILILLWIWDETHFDRQHTLRDRIFQVKSFHKYPDGNFVDDATSGALSSGLRELPEIERTCRMSYNNSRILVQRDDKSFYEQGVFADTSVFNIFTIPIIEGVAFGDLNTIVLSQKAAHKYFPDESAVGKSIRVNAEQDVTVTGVFQDLPSTSTMQFDFMMAYGNYAMRDKYNEEWGAWTGGFTYVLLHPATDLNSLTEKIQKNITEPRIWPRWDASASLFLFPFADTHLRDNFNNDGIQEGGRIAYVRIFSLVGIFILLVAIINFMNLATARSVSRAKEIGVRKVSGALKASLVRQFFSESVLLTLVALLVALVVVQLVLPSFETLTNKNLSVDFTNPVLIGLIMVITLLTGLFAGSYPAFLLSSLKPIVVLKGKFTGTGGKNMRRGLVVFQFGLSTVLIVCALAAHQQVKYMKDKDLGFDRDNIVYFAASKAIDRNLEAFKKSALENPKVISVAQGRSNPMKIDGGMVLSDNAWPGKTKDDNIIFIWTQCDFDFIPTLGMKILKGRNFSKDNPADTLNFIINEEAARQMKLTDPIGAKLVAPHEGKIIGVVNDFNNAPLDYAMQPVIIAMTPKINPLVFVKYEAGQSQEVLSSLQSIYKTFEPDLPMEYQFMDAPFNAIYQDEILIERLSLYFTVIAVFISCLGLFGLASFMAESRTKEIGIRKVLGASETQIVTLLGKDFVLLIAFALAIGLPIGWWGVDYFLSKYAFHTEISVWLFLSVVLGMMGITFISVGYQSAKAAITNPVTTLRSE